MVKNKETPYANAYRKKVMGKGNGKLAIDKKKETTKKGKKTKKKSTTLDISGARKGVPSKKGTKVPSSLGNEIKEEYEEIKEVLSSKKARRIERYIIGALYLAVFLIAGYFVLANYFPGNPITTVGNYEVSAGDALIFSELNGLYIDKDYVLGDVVEIDNRTVRIIGSAEPFNFVLNPKGVLADNTTAKLRISFVRPRTEVYLDDRLIIPNLRNYFKVADYEKKEVWVKRELTVDSDYNLMEFDTSATSAEDFIYANFPGHNIYAFGEVEGGAPILSDYNKTATSIDTTFRDNLNLAVYAEGTLEIEFTKKDLNWYIGKDEYTVEVTDSSGEVFFSETYEDDEVNKDTRKEGKDQDIKIEVNGLEKNIYYVNFIKDKYNEAPDSTIKDIKINSNKIVIVGNFLPIDNFEFYTQVDSPKNIGFKYWWADKEQTIKQTGAVNDTIDLDEDWVDERYVQELNKTGGYNFEIDEGIVRVSSDVISPSKENWFYLPKESDSKLLVSDVILISKDVLEIDENSIIYTGDVNISENRKFKIQALDEVGVYFEEMEIDL